MQETERFRDSDEAMGFLDAQLPALASLLLGSLLCGSAPFLIRKLLPRCGLSLFGKKRRNPGISFLTYVGNGLLFATAMLYLIPQVHHDFSIHSEELPPNGTSSEELEHSGNSSDEWAPGSHHHHDHHHHHHESFPLPEFCVACGFFAAYLIEVLVGPADEASSSALETSPSVKAKFCSCSQRNIECSRIYKPDPITSPGRRKRSATWAGHVGEEIGKPEPLESPPDLLQASLKSHKFPNYGAAMSLEHAGIPIRIDGLSLLNRPVAMPSAQHLPRIPETTNGEFSFMALTVATLSLYSIFEGAAIGFQNNIFGTWSLFLGIGAHKFFTAFFIGVETVIEKCSILQTIIMLSVFSLASPTSMALAITLVEYGPSTVNVVLNALAGGALLYISCFESFPMLGKRHSCNQFKFLGTLVGAGIMATVQYTLH